MLNELQKDSLPRAGVPKVMQLMRAEFCCEVDDGVGDDNEARLASSWEISRAPIIAAQPPSECPVNASVSVAGSEYV